MYITYARAITQRILMAFPNNIYDVCIDSRSEDACASSNCTYMFDSIPDSISPHNDDI